MIKIEKTEQQDLYKTGPGSFIVDNPVNQVQAYKDRLKQMEQRDREIDMMKDRINNIDQDLCEIKSLLKQLVQKAN